MRQALVVVICLFGTSLGAQGVKAPKPLASPTSADLERGHALFDAQCARCVTGEPLWEFQAGAPVRSNPISFLLDGKQHVAVAAGQAVFVFAPP